MKKTFIIIPLIIATAAFSACTSDTIETEAQYDQVIINQYDKQRDTLEELNSNEQDRFDSADELMNQGE